MSTAVMAAVKVINMIDENTIWQSRQNHPELVIQDCKHQFKLTDKQCKELRFILMNRGINKWLYARRKFIDLKHRMKLLIRVLHIKNISKLSGKDLVKENKGMKLDMLNIYSDMQGIAKMPRWVEWGRLHKKMKNSMRDIIIKGRRC